VTKVASDKIHPRTERKAERICKSALYRQGRRTVKMKARPPRFKSIMVQINARNASDPKPAARARRINEPVRPLP
jgi:hypothetical protein